ncbi:MAG: FeoA family protein [Methermicoccaceae archaeon]
MAVKTEHVERSLNQVDTGGKAMVSHVKGKGATRRRILDMGIVPGAEIEVVRSAPFNDPIELRVKGYNLSMRRAEAELIVVGPLEAQ